MYYPYGVIIVFNNKMHDACFLALLRNSRSCLRDVCVVYSLERVWSIYVHIAISFEFNNLYLLFKISIDTHLRSN